MGKQLRLPVIVFLLALVARLAFYLWGMRFLPDNFQKFFTADTMFYYDPIALGTAADGLNNSLLSFTRFTFLGYLSSFYRIFGYDYWPVSIFHCFLGALSVLLIYLSVRLFLGEKVSLAVAAVSAFNPVLLYWTPFVTSEAFFFFVLSLTLYVFSVYIKTERPVFLPLIALCSLLIFISRPIGILLSVSLLAFLSWMAAIKYAFLKCGKFKPLFIIFALLFAIFTLVARYGHKAEAIVSQPYAQELLKLSFYIDQMPNEGRDSRHLKVHSARLSLPPMMKIKKAAVIPGEVTLTGILEYLKKYPGKYAGLIGSRFYTLFNPWVREYSFKHNLFNLIFYSAFYLFSIIGLIQIAKHSPRFFSLILVTILSLTLTLLLTLVDYDFRLRLPIELILCLPCGAGICRLMD